MTLPDFTKVAKAFGIHMLEFRSQNILAHSISNIFDIASQAPIIVVMHMEPNEIIAPRVQAKTENGKFIPTDICDMWPFLPREEFALMKQEKGIENVVKRLDAI